MTAGETTDRTVDLNADLGEEVTDDDGLLGVVTSANVACGFHAGNDAIMSAVCELAAARGVRIGAQVSYADREGFGRRPTEIPRALLTDQVAEQVQTLAAHAAAAGTTVSYVKPHGALYHRVIEDPEQAAAVLDGSVLDGVGLPVLGFPASRLLLEAAARGRSIITEGFPDRGYLDGHLIARDQPGALLTSAESMAAQAVALAPTVGSLCLHGDSPDAVAHAHVVRDALEDAGWRVATWS